jgi:hypothetical protein
LWKGLKSIGTATLQCVRDGKETTETRYYISSLPVGVKQFAHAIRRGLAKVPGGLKPLGGEDFASRLSTFRFATAPLGP